MVRNSEIKRTEKMKYGTKKRKLGISKDNSTVQNDTSLSTYDSAFSYLGFSDSLPSIILQASIAYQEPCNIMYQLHNSVQCLMRTPSLQTIPNLLLTRWISMGLWDEFQTQKYPISALRNHLLTGVPDADNAVDDDPD
ncbi:hypothetical protein BVG19_g247 [[Candida] boidinii]|nr:hypothetical protein BVG19_g247 [[Candida] boidinii]OWB49768.1 hypothetical protein B5S27_g1312 [[Candida] boidinii]OWB68164.1 hypothetical protein B5S30_g3538 [[Candida] boidinii]